VIERSEIDSEKLKSYLKLVSGSIAAGISCALSAVGDSLGLYRALHELESATSVELAERTGLSERWLREWLRHQACMKQIDYDAAADRFHLSPEAVAVLLDDTHPAHLAGAFQSAVATFPSLPSLTTSFQTGLGRSYDDHGADCACGIERMSAYTNRFALVPELLPALDGVVDKLRRGARVADVGCGAGSATLAMAEAFPASEFVGYDISRHALARATDKLAAGGHPNVRFLNPETHPLPVTPVFDLVTTFDVVHDTPYPEALICSIQSALRDDGTWFCSDIRSFPTFEENRAGHPLAGMLYGFSLMVCMASGLSRRDGAGLGTLGFNEAVARDMTSRSGFTRFRRIDHDNVMNNFYEIRK